MDSKPAQPGSTTSPPEGPAIVCRICGETLDERPSVLCGICQTPYHRDCWTYHKKCAIYGCGSRAYTEVGQDQSLAPASRTVEFALPGVRTRLAVSFLLGLPVIVLYVCIVFFLAAHWAPASPVYDLLLKLAPLVTVAAMCGSFSASRSTLRVDLEDQRAQLVFNLFGLPFVTPRAFSLGENPEIALLPAAHGTYVAVFRPGKGSETFHPESPGTRPEPIELTGRFVPDSEEGARSIARVHRLADELGVSLRIPADPRISDTLRLLTPGEKRVALPPATGPAKPDPDPSA